MELQARFDEEHQHLLSATGSAKKGAHVIFAGIQGLKVHCKAFARFRKEKGHLKLYANVPPEITMSWQQVLMPTIVHIADEYYSEPQQMPDLREQRIRCRSIHLHCGMCVWKRFEKN